MFRNRCRAKPIPMFPNIKPPGSLTHSEPRLKPRNQPRAWVFREGEVMENKNAHDPLLKIRHPCCDDMGMPKKSAPMASKKPRFGKNAHVGCWACLQDALDACTVFVHHFSTFPHLREHRWPAPSSTRETQTARCDGSRSGRQAASASLLGSAASTGCRCAGRGYAWEPLRTVSVTPWSTPLGPGHLHYPVWIDAPLAFLICRTPILHRTTFDVPTVIALSVSRERALLPPCWKGREGAAAVCIGRPA